MVDKLVNIDYFDSKHKIIGVVIFIDYLQKKQ